MDITRYSLSHTRVTWFLLAVMLLGGIYAFLHLGKKEDAPFVIKSAVLMTRYPGASPEEVEMLITEPIEREIQSMRLVHKIVSESQYGLSKITIELSPSIRADRMPQMWDELRRKVANISQQLPPGASAITVNDDFGDLYGIYYGLKADPDIDDEQLRYWAQRIKRQVATIDGVQKVTVYGEQSPVVNVFVSMSRLSNFAIRPQNIIEAMSQQNRIIDSGEKLKTTEELCEIPESGHLGTVLSFLIPLLIVALVVYGIVANGWSQGITTFLYWIAVNAGCTFIATAAALAHPLNILACSVTAPFFALNPVLGVGMLGGILEATFRKPKVKDFQDLNDDATVFRGWYRNRILHCLLVFFFSSLGSVIGTFVAFPLLIARI